MTRDPPRGRGSASNPAGRFDRLLYVSDPDAPPEESSALATQFLRDASKSVLSKNESPDLPFEWSLNPYRGCEHGCAYCYARPYHEYLGFSAGLDFESRILVKEDAPALLAKELMRPGYQAGTLSMSGVTDPYQPAERHFRVTRACLEVLAEARHPVAVITKNRLITRDADLLGELARHHAAAVYISITTLDPDLCRKLEPRASAPEARLAAIRELRAAGIPAGVMAAPIIPALTDNELGAIVEAAAQAGAQFAAWIPLRLPSGVETLFEDWLASHVPLRARRVMNRLREIRGGKVNDPRFGHRFRARGPWGDVLRQIYEAAVKKTGLEPRAPRLSAASFRPPEGDQPSLFR